ncbi:hypothetical protein WJX73_009339 [Symbiochloris irregularis]|uniref:Uncharacterized protein n=1 Tax=Symbiochloris irregularis TaxID=706552 RepID=A0AAW1NI01_9CHLO
MPMSISGEVLPGAALRKATSRLQLWIGRVLHRGKPCRAELSASLLRSAAGLVNGNTPGSGAEKKSGRIVLVNMHVFLTVAAV